MNAFITVITCRYLRHHDQSEAAANLIVHPKLKWQPNLIPPYAKKFVPVANANCLSRSKEILRAIMIHQGDVDDSTFYEAL